MDALPDPSGARPFGEALPTLDTPRERWCLYDEWSDSLLCGLLRSDFERPADGAA